MSPKSNEEQLWSDLFLNVKAGSDNLVLWLSSNSTDSLEHSCQFTDVESVMELSWCRKKSLLYGLPNADGSIDQVWTHVNNFWVVFLWTEQDLKDSTIDIFNGLLGWSGHVD